MLIDDSWKKCDERIARLGVKGWDGISDKEAGDGINSFLQRLGFLSDIGLSDIGRKYYQARHVYNDESGAMQILTEQVRKLSSTQAICQLLWGKKNLKRNNIYNLLASERLIDGNSVTEDSIGSFLMLLNYCGLIVYRKQTGDVQVIYNARGEEKPLPPDIFISKDTPYSNVINLRQILRHCKGHINWIDKHYSAKGLEALSQEADANKINSIKILAGRGQNIPNLKTDYDRFSIEMQNRGIATELRVICENETFNDIHDRWIVAENICYNVPAINSIYQNQSAEMKETNNRPPFEKWWTVGLPIKEKYDDILKASKI